LWKIIVIKLKSDVSITVISKLVCKICNTFLLLTDALRRNLEGL